eukprot:1640720-Pleurochrysis_carterae.AAC.1
MNERVEQGQAGSRCHDSMGEWFPMLTRSRVERGQRANEERKPRNAGCEKDRSESHLPASDART